MTERPIDRWRQLRAEGAGDGAIEVPSISSGVETGFGPARFAVGPSGEPRLLVPFGHASLKLDECATSKLAITISRFTLGGRACAFIDVMSLERSLDAVFAELADEVLHRIERGHAPTTAVESTIGDFRELLREGARADVPDSAIIGLVGELVVLEMLCGISPDAIEAWTGPFDQRHDFRKITNALEVKSSGRADASSVCISSIEQLTEPAGGSLTLIHVTMERTQDGPLSVSRLVEKIEGLGVKRVDLIRRLSAMGCLEPDSPDWNRIEFGLEGITGYHVRNGFPRIHGALFQGSKLPIGILAISYEVDLKAARAFELDESGLASALAGVAE